MAQVAVVSGKGGTGKTMVTAGLVRLAGRVVAVDADVDAANLGLLLPGDDGPSRDFMAGTKARLDPEVCVGCMSCAAVCRFGALEMGPGGDVALEPLRCEGCGACGLVCPSEAISFVDNHAGTWTVRETEWGPLVHARLGVAQGSSGKLVALLREEGRARAADRGIEHVLIDGPPGVGCPVHATLTGVDLVVAVTEPTQSGAHDLARLLELAGKFKLNAALVINKHDLSERLSEQIALAATSRGVPLLGHIPFNPDVPHALARGESPLAVPPVRDSLERVWQAASALVQPHAGAAAGQTSR
jgi:MinD superfamily P-loop ATPase